MTGCLTLLARLTRDNAGNTLAIAAASLIPLMALIGGGVDVSRAYMAKTELQSACDAGVLAGRKALSKTGTYGTAEKAKATSMFNFNFNAKSLDVSNLTYDTHDNTDGQVLGTATATLPTLVMKIFDQDTIDLTVDCMAELQIGNADIMFVLDTTGSMLCTPEDTNSPCTQLSASSTSTRIYGLREAVKDFHKTINQSVTDNRTRIRYGFVPYSMTVNVGGLIASGDMPTSYIADSTSYQTRLAEFNTPYVVVTANSPTTVNTTETYSSTITQTQCNSYGVNNYPTSGSNPVNSGGPAPTATVVTTYSYQSWTKTSGSGSSAKGTCKRNKSAVTTTYNSTTWQQFTRWIYQSDPVNTTNYGAKVSTSYATGITASSTAGSTSRVRSSTKVTADMVDLAALAANGDATGISTTSGTWNGCIEERQAVTPTISYDYDPIPDDADDMNFDLEPTSDATSWKPMWHAMYRLRSSSSSSSASYYLRTSDLKYYSNSSFSGSSVTPPTSTPTAYCPPEMMLFRTVELSDDPNDVPSWLNTYINNLVAQGSTYHDIGMIWGGRLTSPTGIFADNVTLDADKINVSRHIIFMTDGQMEPSASSYSSYGIENYDHRIAPSGYESTITARHNARFSAMCEAVKAQGTTIWVVAFAQTMTTELQNCASDGRAYYSSNTAALKNTFKYIAAQVADLRLGA